MAISPCRAIYDTYTHALHLSQFMPAGKLTLHVSMVLHLLLQLINRYGSIRPTMKIMDE